MKEKIVFHYKPELNMADQISVTMAAGNWAQFLAWIQSTDTEPIIQIAHGEIIPQVVNHLYTPESLKSAEAAAHEAHEKAHNPLAMFGPRMPGQVPNAEDFEEGDPTETTEVWIIVCDECGSRDEYTTMHTGPLTCEHNGPRHVAAVFIRRTGEDE